MPRTMANHVRTARLVYEVAATTSLPSHSRRLEPRAAETQPAPLRDSGASLARQPGWAMPASSPPAHSCPESWATAGWLIAVLIQGRAPLWFPVTRARQT